MELVKNNRDRGLSAGATVLLTGGVVLVVLGIALDSTARAAGGASLTMIGLTLAVIATIRRWITDTTAERRRHLDAAKSCDDERTRYVAAQAALAMERDRIHRDAVAEQRKVTARLEHELALLRDQFEAKRAQLIADTFETAARMVNDGLLDAPHQQQGAVIDFPARYAPHLPAVPADDRGLSRT